MIGRAMLLIGAVGILTACSPSEKVSAEPVPQVSTPAPVLDSPANLPEAFVVSTNEPFWQATVDGKALVLKGPEGERTLSVIRNEAVFDGRVVSAEDTKGKLEVRIAPIACQDSMAGNDFPYTAKVVFDSEEPIIGCGRPLPGGSSQPANPKVTN